MVDIFLSDREKQNVQDYDVPVQDNSISTKLLFYFWFLIAKLFPANVAPNVISLAGLLCLMQAWYLTINYIDMYPRAVTVGSMLLVFSWQTFDGVSRIHAKNVRNEYALVEYFKEVCDTVGCIFLMAVLCEVMGIRSYTDQWYVIQTAQLIFLQSYLKAFETSVLRYRLLAGPGEVLSLFYILMVLRATVGLDVILINYKLLVTRLQPFVENISMLEGTTFLQTLYYLFYIRAFVTALFLPRSNSITRNGILLCLFYRLIPAILIQFVFMQKQSQEVTLIGVMCDGLFMSIITSDVILSRMAKRDLHPWVVIFSMASIFNHFLIVVLCVFYYTTVFWEICEYTHLPLLTICKNVYVDGIFDLCHIGHKNLFKNALVFGNRLLVGVCSDEDATPYKRKPIMTTQERINEVQGCKNVHEVIPNAPCNGLTEEFIKKHNIHVVAHSVEYDKPNDIYYAVPRKMGITRVLPRTEGLSTSELIRRVQAYGVVEGNNTKKANPS